MVVCVECGSKEIETQMWVKINTQEIVDENGDDCVWCPCCGENTGAVTISSTNTNKKLLIIL